MEKELLTTSNTCRLFMKKTRITIDDLNTGLQTRKGWPLADYGVRSDGVLTFGFRANKAFKGKGRGRIGYLKRYKGKIFLSYNHDIYFFQEQKNCSTVLHIYNKQIAHTLANAFIGKNLSSVIDVSKFKFLSDDLVIKNIENYKNKSGVNHIKIRLKDTWRSFGGVIIKYLPEFFY